MKPEWNAPRKPLRRIVKKEYWRCRNHPTSAKDSVTVTLECGHTVRFKGSQEPENKAGCWRCREDLIQIRSSGGSN